MTPSGFYRLRGECGIANAQPRGASCIALRFSQWDWRAMQPASGRRRAVAVALRDKNSKKKDASWGVMGGCGSHRATAWCRIGRARTGGRAALYVLVLIALCTRPVPGTISPLGTLSPFSNVETECGKRTWGADGPGDPSYDCLRSLPSGSMAIPKRRARLKVDASTEEIAIR